MLDIKFILQYPEEVKKGIKNKGVDPSLVDEVLNLDSKRRELIKKIEALRAKRNIANEKLLKAPNQEKEEILKVLKEVKIVLSQQEKELKEIEENFKKKMSLLPNLPLPNVPIGKDETGNVVIKEVGKKPFFNFPPKDYIQISENLDIIDVKRAAKTSGSRFGFLKKEGALLEIGLIQFAIELLSKKGFEIIIPPTLIKPELMWAMGYVDRGKEEIYYLEKDNLYLIGTAEQIIGPMYAGEIFNENELPKRIAAFSSCYRREAGSYGKDTKGILRVHQFDKVEMFVFSKPEDSINQHQFLLSLEEEIMQKLGIPYRLINICTGDLGDPAAAKYDIEAWLPGQNEGKGEYRETHSTSNCTDFQARRLNTKYKTKNGLEFVHTLNGTAIAIGRTIIAIIENYQTKEGFVKIPKVLWKYTNGVKIIKR
ncbi:MAG TPA: serine--tRNA ligase [Candidatus Paceibacterota bacterium]|nr:serine--tRNA ligase [Candidatus Paceibacterota bacterium]HPP64920.1 serine--tRNA ligase [Candidatus Paceibacterota bacterium]